MTRSVYLSYLQARYQEPKAPYQQYTCKRYAQILRNELLNRKANIQKTDDCDCFYNLRRDGFSHLCENSAPAGRIFGR